MQFIRGQNTRDLQIQYERIDGKPRRGRSPLGEEAEVFRPGESMHEMQTFHRRPELLPPQERGLRGQPHHVGGDGSGGDAQRARRRGVHPQNSAALPKYRVW